MNQLSVSFCAAYINLQLRNVGDHTATFNLLFEAPFQVLGRDYRHRFENVTA